MFFQISHVDALQHFYDWIEAAVARQKKESGWLAYFCIYVLCGRRVNIGEIFKLFFYVCVHSCLVSLYIFSLRVLCFVPIYMYIFFAMIILSVRLLVSLNFSPPPL